MPSLRPRRADDLGLRHALSDRLLPLMVACMVFLAALAGAGAMAAARLAARWQSGAASLATVQVPQPGEPAASGGTRADAAAKLLGSLPGASLRRLTAPEVAGLLQPWLGEDAARLTGVLPAVFELRASRLPPALQGQLEAAAPGTLLERNGAWSSRLAGLAGSLQACAALALGVVAFVSAGMVAVAARAGLSARRDSIEIVHGLGATRTTIASRFAARVTLLAGAGACLGILAAAPVLLGMARIAAPFQVTPPDDGGAMALPPQLWALLALLPLLAAAIGWITTQATVRLWLARLP